MNIEFIAWIVALVSLIAFTVYMFVNENEKDKRDDSFITWLIKIVMLVVAMLLTAYIAYKTM